MPRVTNTSGGLMILPDGSRITAGDSADVTAETLGNAGVSQWVQAGWLDVEKPKPAKPVESKREKE